MMDVGPVTDEANAGDETQAWVMTVIGQFAAAPGVCGTTLCLAERVSKRVLKGITFGGNTNGYTRDSARYS